MRELRLSPWLLCPLFFPAAYSQTLPQIQPGGIVNAASYAQPIAPGSAASIFGTNFASSVTTGSGDPLPTELAGTSVTVNGIKAPLLFVSPGQINLQVPWEVGVAYAAFTTATVVVSTPVGPSSPVQVPVYSTSPAAFTSDGSGCGQAAALNINADGTLSVNSPSNSAAQGDYIALFGTGLSTYSIPDGTYATGPTGVSIAPGLSVDGTSVNQSYAGLAPMLVGVDQINFQIPSGTRDGCAVPISIDDLGLIGPTVSVSIHSGRGQCVDPPIQSYGQITLTKTVSTGTGNDGTTETFTATFPSAPGLKGPPQQTILPPGAWMAAVPNPTPVNRTCKGNPQLSAGAISVKAATTGQTINIQPTQVADGVVYQQSLPNGFIQPGPYSISASGTPVAFDGTFSVGAPIQVQPTLTPGTQISSSQPLVVNWTGGDPGEQVRVSLIGVLGGGVYSEYDYGYADVLAGTFTFDPICYGHSIITGGNGVECSFGIPSTRNAEVVVEVSPAPSSITEITAQGITQTVQLSWVYRYVFGGLSLQ